MIQYVKINSVNNINDIINIILSMSGDEYCFMVLLLWVTARSRMTLTLPFIIYFPTNSFKGDTFISFTYGNHCYVVKWHFLKIFLKDAV